MEDGLILASFEGLGQKLPALQSTIAVKGALNLVGLGFSFLCQVLTDGCYRPPSVKYSSAGQTFRCP